MKDFGYTIASAREAFLSGTLTPERLFEHYQRRIAEQNGTLNAYRSVDFSYADHGRDASILAGIPYALKDNMLVGGTIATAGSKILERYVSAYDSTVYAKLRSGGAQLLGKTNMDEFAMGSSGENSAYGVVRNPWDTDRVPGGSSAGSAAAVAADLCVFSLGSDTGGSIRQPAAMCGVVGLKPTYGRVSRHGLMAMASSLDQIGPFTKTVEDAALVLGAIAGPDPLDSTTVPHDVPDYVAEMNGDMTGVRVGVPKEYFGEGLSAEVRERVEGGIRALERAGAEIVEVSLPHSAYALAVYYIVQPSEVSANLARYDGIRYGHSASDADTLLEVYTKSRAQGFGPEPLRRIMLGTYALSAGYFDAYYLRAQKVRALIRQDFDRAFERVDVIVGPTSPTVAFKIGEKSDDPLAMYLSDIYTVPVNLAGVPALSVPCGLGAASGLPVGFHIIGDMFREGMVLRVARHIEHAVRESSEHTH
ncbi:MAG: Asp-tRNA(Asn)/Glu-tRNA(Gln) amidotransferase subunit GatA [Candidatus Yanofskybacteria bacterium]|nr:Asp-tRNA(Asn)/Glu-tRNA(Gln) amidotransferase subunit GatA [Candidatus Yanofskybacteria bacterium]